MSTVPKPKACKKVSNRPDAASRSSKDKRRLQQDEAVARPKKPTTTRKAGAQRTSQKVQKGGKGSAVKKRPSSNKKDAKSRAQDKPNARKAVSSKESNEQISSDAPLALARRPSAQSLAKPTIISPSASMKNNTDLEEEMSDIAITKDGPAPNDDRSYECSDSQRIEFLRKWIDAKTSGGISMMKAEYKATPLLVGPEECRVFSKNMEKNRYANIPCLDKTRVLIPEEEKFYIHANRVRACSSWDRFVCTQGPLPETVDDFWIMIQSLETTFIIMLCSFVEGGVPKCARYYPEAGNSLDTDNFTITTQSTTEWNGDGPPTQDRILQSKLKYINKTTGKEGRITHYQWQNWPDHGSPDSAETTLRLLAAVRRPGSKSPVVVHCSAGVGRTGTIVLVESLIQALCSPKSCDAKDCFSNLRKDRAKMVQTFPQYVYAIRCVLEYFIGKGCSKNEESWALFKDQCIKFLARKKRVEKDKPMAKKMGSFSAEDDPAEKEKPAAIPEVKEAKEAKEGKIELHRTISADCVVQKTVEHREVQLEKKADGAPRNPSPSDDIQSTYCNGNLPY